MSEINAFDRLQLERERTLFTFYGHHHHDGTPGSPYLKLAHSLREALTDLEHNDGIADEGGFLVRDAFLERDEDGTPILHVELSALQQSAG